MTEAEQLAEDLKLLRRVDGFAKGLSPKQVDLVESFMRRLTVEKRSLSPAQRKIAEEFDERYVE